MSNIFTEHVRLCFCPGVSMTAHEFEALLEKILGERGSYWVPVWYELHPGSHVDLQYGSGKGAGLYNLDEADWAPFEQVWVRFADEGSDDDIIYEWSPLLGETPYDHRSSSRPCRYGFDSLEVVLRENSTRMWLPEGLHWEKRPDGFVGHCRGTYRALNERADMAIGPSARLHSTKRSPGGISTPSTPCHGSRSPSFDGLEEPVLRFLENGQDAMMRIDLQHGNRVVHRAEWHGPAPGGRSGHWRHHCADHWDNCLDEAFLRMRCGRSG